MSEHDLCPTETTITEHVTNFEFIEAIVCPYADVAGLLVVGLLVYGAIAGSIYIRTGSAIIPFGLLLLTGGATMSHVAGPGVGLATVVFLLVGGGAIAYAYYEWSR